ncbi:hypothetical protein BGZ61DRAFT_355684 [Ilyonectria robusta]|uniref:uncharacterized protein n=1 Tax=Ilyonectria robusta TaxID=1079257 RepID=UPI001E8D6466|nr:uncharacterized protein BGZ61DRAFT_355684 [Ilyonectria robusta]KAH8686453.1 hypothetical protein BGZ61DRAFT_355684 [Ilyonectria robusta]
MGSDLPDSNSPDLGLAHPTPEERVEIWTNVAASWKDSFTVPVFLEESKYLTTVPLAKEGGMTIWILVDKNLPPNERPILCSCESFVKRTITSDADGNTDDNIVHGIASVFCPEEYRRRGYAARHMREMAKALYRWKPDQGKCVGSILYSDIGKIYYTRLGWLPHPNNAQLVFPSIPAPASSSAQEVVEDDLARLCERDEGIVRKAMATPARVQRRLTIVPTLEHMLFHIRKEDFTTQHIFGKIPTVKGAIAGPLGSQVWAIWYYRYYGHPDWPSTRNVLYILRLVVEGDESRGKPLAETTDSGHQAGYLKAVIQAAQAEAARWRLDHVKLWDPTPLVQDLVAKSGIDHVLSERDKHIASGLWYDDKGDMGAAPTWISNEYYSFC